MPPTIVIDSLLEAVNPTVWLLGFPHARIPPENDHVLTSQDGVGAAEGNFTGEPRAMSWSGAVESVAQSILSQRFGSSLRSQLASGIQKMQPGISASIRLSRPAFMPKIAPHELMPLPETRFESESFWPTPTHARISQTCSAKLRPMRRMHASAPATPRTATAQFGARLGSNFALQRIFPRIKIDWLAHACTHGRKRRPAGHRRVRPSVRPSVRRVVSRSPWFAPPSCHTDVGASPMLGLNPAPSLIHRLIH